MKTAAEGQPSEFVVGREWLEHSTYGLRGRAEVPQFQRGSQNGFYNQ